MIFFAEKMFPPIMVKIVFFFVCSESDPSDDSSSKLEEKTNTQNLQNSENLPGVSFWYIFTIHNLVQSKRALFGKFL